MNRTTLVSAILVAAALTPALSCEPAGPGKDGEVGPPGEPGGLELVYAFGWFEASVIAGEGELLELWFAQHPGDVRPDASRARKTASSPAPGDVARAPRAFTTAELDDTCCVEGDPCGWGGDNICDCGGTVEWETDDCGEAPATEGNDLSALFNYGTPYVVVGRGESTLGIDIGCTGFHLLLESAGAEASGSGALPDLTPDDGCRVTTVYSITAADSVTAVTGNLRLDRETTGAGCTRASGSPDAVSASTLELDFTVHINQAAGACEEIVGPAAGECCDTGDSCGLAGNDDCDCPEQTWDYADCSPCTDVDHDGFCAEEDCDDFDADLGDECINGGCCAINDPCEFGHDDVCDIVWCELALAWQYESLDCNLNDACCGETDTCNLAGSGACDCGGVRDWDALDCAAELCDADRTACEDACGADQACSHVCAANYDTCMAAGPYAPATLNRTGL